jgi:hypothetical protein
MEPERCWWRSFAPGPRSTARWSRSAESVLNDWPDREAAAILSRCAEAAGPAGCVVILKSVGPDGASRDLYIEMVLLGGKHRTATEFRELARHSGLAVVSAGQSSGYFVVECRTDAAPRPVDMA